MLKYFAAAVVSLFLLAPDPASAEISCTPHCDYNHYYGPSDYTYVRPGLFGYPRCGPRGDCSPYLVYRSSFSGLRFTVRPRKQVRSRRR